MTAAEEPIEAEVVQLHKTLVVQPLELPRQPGVFGAAVARVVDRPFPSLHQVRVATVWWALRLLRLIPWIPVLLWRELRPTLRGVGRVATAWSKWAAAEKDHQYAKLGEGNTGAKLGAGASKKASARAIESAVGFLLWSAGWVWLWISLPIAAIAGSLLVMAVFDAVGRKGVEMEPFLPPVALPAVLTSNVPLGQITESILGVFEREGFVEGSVRVAVPLAWDHARFEYRISLAVADGIKPEHLRAIERGIGARDYSIRSLATATATVRELVISIGDPLAGAEECEWIPTGALSFTQPLPLGRSAGETPMDVRFVGAHAAIVGTTRAGKTEGLLWTLIDRLAACSDVVLWGIDLQAGPAFPLWRKVIQRVAYEEAEALDLLEAALVEMKRRKRILTALAESDAVEDENAGTVWTGDLGSYLVILVDEFALAATFNGEKGKADLLSPLEEIARTGLKFGVHLVLATQKTGNSDFGSSVMQTQLGIRILMACKEGDTVRLLSTEHRDTGWAPHLLKPAQGDIPNDAGKAYIDGPDHRTPDVYRADFWPKGSIKARARRRLADGLPTLEGGKTTTAVDAVEVPAVLAAVESAFREAGNPDRMATSELLVWLRDAGLELDENRLAGQLRECCSLRPADKRWSPAPKANPVRGYLLADVRAAVRGLA